MQVSGLSINSTAINVSWLPVRFDKRNGIILGYWIHLSKSSWTRSVQVLGASTLSKLVGGLKPLTNYSVKACAFTVKGNGKNSTAVVIATDEQSK